MKQKMLIISLFLVIGLVLSSLLAVTSLSFTKQIKSTFSEDENELFEEFAKPPAEEMTVLEDKKGVDDGIPVLMFFKDKIAQFVSSNPGNINQKAAYYSLIIILLLMITYFLAKRYIKKRNRNRNSNKRYDFEEVQIQPTVLKNKDRIEKTLFTKEKRVATPFQIHETRKLLQKWEAGLVGKRMKEEAETINEWFARINGPVEIISIYEKVRYGEQNCTEDEVRFIKNTLKL